MTDLRERELRNQLLVLAFNDVEKAIELFGTYVKEDYQECGDSLEDYNDDEDYQIEIIESYTNNEVSIFDDRFSFNTLIGRNCTIEELRTILKVALI